MELTDRQNELIQKFIDCSLSKNESKEFKKLHEENELFAKEAEDQAFTASALEAIGQGMRGKYYQQEKNRTVSKTVLYSTLVTAATVAIILSLSFFLKKFERRPLEQIVKTDTIFLPKKEFHSLPEAIARTQYAQNIEMEKLVDITSRVSRGNDDDICLPANNKQFIKGQNIAFLLPGFKPGTYRLNILGFHEHITAVDTICNNIISITQSDKQIYSWKPKISGIYYWMIYITNKEQPYVVRKLKIAE